jgi:hypothetical protein
MIELISANYSAAVLVREEVFCLAIIFIVTALESGMRTVRKFN